MSLRDLTNRFKKSFSDDEGWFQQGKFTPKKYLNPTSNKGNNFWSTPVAKKLVNTQQKQQRFGSNVASAGKRLLDKEFAFNPYKKLSQSPNPIISQPSKLLNTVISAPKNIAKRFVYDPQKKEALPQALWKDPNLQGPVWKKQGESDQQYKERLNLSTQAISRLGMNMIGNIKWQGGPIKPYPFSDKPISKEVINKIGKIEQQLKSNFMVRPADPTNKALTIIDNKIGAVIDDIYPKFFDKPPKTMTMGQKAQALVNMVNNQNIPNLLDGKTDIQPPKPIKITGPKYTVPDKFKDQSGAINLGAKVGQEPLPVKFQQDFSKLIADRDVARTVATQKATKLVSIPSNIAKEVIDVREGLTTSTNKQVNDAVALIDKEFKLAYNDAEKAMKDAGLKIGFLDNYLPHFWKESPQQVQEVFTNSKSFKQSKGRTIPTYKEGIELGLTPKYAHPAEMHEAYIRNLETFKSNVNFFNKLRVDGLISKTPKEGYVPIQAQGLGRNIRVVGGGVSLVDNWYAPEGVAGQINKIFNPVDQGQLGKVLDVTAKVSAGIQDIVLSGGLPATPLNAFTLAQVQKELISGRIKSPIMSVVDSLSPKRINKFFADNSGQIKKMQERNVTIRSSYEVKNMLDRSAKEKLFGEGLSGTWDKLTGEPTFGKFMPALQIRLFNDIEKSALKQGMSGKEAADVAAKAVTKFYGLTDTGKEALRDKTVADLSTTALFASKYRESMVNFWINNLKALKNPLALENRTNAKFIVGAILTYLVMDNINHRASGKGMNDNPTGKKDKLLIPTDKGYTIGIPFLSSIATVPRGLFRIAGKLGKVDLAGATKETFKTFASIGLKPLGEIASNEDHFGREIYTEDDSGADKAKKMVAHMFGSLNHPYVRGFMELYTKPDQPTEQRLSMVLELPLRFYKTESVENAPFWERYHELKAVQEKFDTIKYKDEGVAYLEKNKDKIEEFEVLKGYMTEYFNETEGGGQSTILKDYESSLAGVKPSLLKDGGFETSKDAPQSKLDKAKIYIKSAVTDPGGLYTSIREDEPIRKLRGGALVTERKLGVSVIDIGDKSTQVDHRIPKWAGGRDTTDNYQALTNEDHKKKTAFERGVMAKVERGDMTARKAKKEIEKWHKDNNIKPVPLTQDEVSTIETTIKETKGSIETYSKDSGLASTVRSKWAVTQLTGLEGDEYKKAYKELVDGGVITRSVAELIKEASLDANEYSYGSGSRWLGGSGSRWLGGSGKAGKSGSKSAKKITIKKVGKQPKIRTGKFGTRKPKTFKIKSPPKIRLSGIKARNVKLPTYKVPNIKVAKIKGLQPGIKLV